MKITTKTKLHSRVPLQYRAHEIHSDIEDLNIFPLKWLTSENEKGREVQMNTKISTREGKIET